VFAITDLKILRFPPQYSLLVFAEIIWVYTRVQKIVYVIIILHSIQIHRANGKVGKGYTMG